VFECLACRRQQQFMQARSNKMKLRVKSAVSLSIVLAAALSAWSHNAIAVEELAGASTVHFVTNVAQFRSLSGEDFLSDCAFHLTGVVTLVDTNRNFMVLQDTTGAVGLSGPIKELNLRVSESVSLDASNCCPMLLKFPDFPYRPAGWEIRSSFEAPQNWGEYHLTRMRGYLHPPVSGEYTFWIASDNSSELWLSVNDDPSKIRKIASIARFEWTLSHEWSKFPSQRSEAIWLNASQSYYIEALQEQTTLGENLSVAWQGSGIAQSVIPAAHLTPWNKGRYATEFLPTNGILSEYWTNYAAGDLSGVGGGRRFESALSVEQLHVTRRAPGQLPPPHPIPANQPWLVENNYQWAEAEGVVTFVGESGDNIFLELSRNKAQVQVRALYPASALARITRNLLVRVRGVCEGIYDEAGNLGPALIWVTTENGVSVVETAATNSPPPSADPSLKATSAPTTPAMGGFYGTRSVVTFNDRVFDKDCLFVQEGSAAMFVSLENVSYKNPLQVGELVDLGGALQPGKSLPILAPLVITEIGWRLPPTPITEPIQYPIPGNRDGRWTEIQGVVHAVNSNGTLSVMGSREPIAVWLGHTAINELSRYVDAKLRACGVLSLTTLGTPVLLVPSRSFIEVDEEAPSNPFQQPIRSIADLKREAADPSSLHRARVAGEVTLRDSEWFFIQDETGGIRVQALNRPPAKIGEAIEVVGFPMTHGATRTLSDAIARSATGIHRAKALTLDLSEGLPGRQNGSLISIQANLLAAKTVGSSQILELQDGGRVFTATLLTDRGRLNEIIPGSQLEITGVCDTESAALPLGTTAKEKAALASLNIWLRSPGDVKLLQGPPWWTWKRTALLISSLSTILSAALLWVHLLRRRLERQKALQLAFSQQVLKRLEDERHRIAANLHDGLGQVLLAIKNQTLLAMQRGSEEGALRQRLDDISGATSQALDEVRQITQGLRPYQLNKLGLTQAIRATVTQVSSDSQIIFASRVEDVDNIFDKDSEIHVYRIIQEAINNIIKHSNATEAAVVVKKRANIISLSIRDNGRGFDVNSAHTSASRDLGYGLTGIAERVRILGGALTIVSQPGEGTSLNIEIPIPVRKQ
jgi:signal transduction histidine kinase